MVIAPLMLPAACANRCTPRWLLPWRPVTWVPWLFFPSLAVLGFAAIYAVVYLDDLHYRGYGQRTDPDWMNTPYPDQPVWRSHLFLLLVISALVVVALLLSIPGWLAVLRPHRVRRQVLGGGRTPVTVFYARTEEPDLTSIFQVDHIERGRERRQPLLLLASADGRMWTARPEGTTVYSHVYQGRTTLTHGARHRNNPWIAPLHAMVDGYGRPVLDPAALARRRLPVDPQAPGYERIRTALAAAGGSYHDPRFVGGPVPGELLVPSSNGRYPAGLVLHRPISNLYGSGRQRHAGLEHLYFGTDTGVCRGLYLSELSEVSEPSA